MKNTLEQNNSTNSHKVNEQRKPCDQQWNNKRIAAKEKTMDKWWQTNEVATMRKRCSTVKVVSIEW